MGGLKAADNSIIDLSDYLEDLVNDVSPVVRLYADEATREAGIQIGVTPDQLSVIQPKIRESVEKQILEFCQDTLAQTELAVNQAYDRLKEEMAAGLVAGNTRQELFNRVQDVFTTLETERSHLIAITESSRAVHSAQIATAQESGLVEGMRFLLSSDACEKCWAVQRQWGDQVIPFGTNISGNNYTAQTMGVPVHPACRCTLLPVLDDDWSTTELKE